MADEVPFSWGRLRGITDREPRIRRGEIISLLELAMIIRHCTDADFVSLSAWLEEEYESAGEGFWCNIGVITRAHADGELLVLLDDDRPDVVAFQVGGLRSPGIMETRPDLRGRGYGKALVNYCIAAAEAEDVAVLRIDCCPQSSIPFWRKMGFTLYREHFVGNGDPRARDYAFRLLPRSFDRAAVTGDRADISIKFATPSGMVIAQSNQTAVVLGQTALLPQRVIAFAPTEVVTSDTLVSIDLAGERVYEGKAKYAALVGVERRDSETFVVDIVRRP